MYAIRSYYDMDTFVDEENVLGVIKSPNTFPNYARSILVQRLSKASRFFDVDLQGWMWFFDKLWEEYGKITEDKALVLASDYAKNFLRNNFV